MNWAKLLVYSFLLIPLIYACVNDGEISITGVYIAQNHSNTIDTLKIFQSGEYQRVLRRTVDNSLIYHGSGKWLFRDGSIKCWDFLVDEDNIYDRRNKNFSHLLITSSFPVTKEFGSVIIDYSHHPGKYYYLKQ